MMSPAAKMPGMLVAIVCDTLISPFSISSPHSAMAPSDETKPSCGTTQSTGTRSCCLVLLLTSVAASIRSPPWISFSSQKVRSSILPAAHSCCTCFTVAAWARNPSRRWIIRTRCATPCRFTAQSNAESPPPVPAVRVLERQLARRERADPAGDEHGAGRIGVPFGHYREARRTVIRSAFEADDPLTEVYRSLPLQRLLRHAAHQVLGEDLGKSGDIEDVLLRIERRELAADLVERIDQATGGAAHPGVKGAEQSRRAGADDRDIFDVLHSPNRNGRQREKGEGSSEGRGERVKIYTRTGDGGDTGLFGGGRVPKHDRRVEAYGQVDELNATIGFALAQEPRTFCRELLETVQKDLFTIGAELATPDPEKLAKA